jgi:NADH-quinone oxidoreductase subunit G
VVASSRPSTLDGAASSVLRFAPGAPQAALTALAAALGSPRADAAALDQLARSARAEADAVRSVAQVVREATQVGASAPRGTGGDVVVIWGERLLAGAGGEAAGQALLAVADAVGVAGKPESGLIGIPAETNGRGLREVGCAAGLAPGLADADPPEQLSDAPGWSAFAPEALLLFEADSSEAGMAASGSVIAFAQFSSEALEAQADVVFPAQVYAEKEGTITHPDGRVQRVRQALGLPGDSRPAWQVLAELCERLGAGTGALSASGVTGLIAGAVPFYAGLTLDEIGGDGVRWQDRDAASAAPEAELSTEPLERTPPAEDGLMLGSAATLWSGPAVEHSPSLRFLASTGPQALLSVEDARRLGVESGDEVELHAGLGSVMATAVVRTGVPAGSVFVSPPALSEGPVEVRARQAVAS